MQMQMFKRKITTANTPTGPKNKTKRGEKGVREKREKERKKGNVTMR